MPINNLNEPPVEGIDPVFNQNSKIPVAGEEIISSYTLVTTPSENQKFTIPNSIPFSVNVLNVEKWLNRWVRYINWYILDSNDDIIYSARSEDYMILNTNISGNRNPGTGSLPNATFLIDTLLLPDGTTLTSDSTYRLHLSATTFKFSSDEFPPENESITGIPLPQERTANRSDPIEDITIVFPWNYQNIPFSINNPSPPSSVTDPPEIQSVTIQDIQTDSITVRVTCNIKGLLDYEINETGTFEGDIVNEGIDIDKRIPQTVHDVIFDNLDPNTLYYFRFQLVSEEGDEYGAWSTTYNETTLAPTVVVQSRGTISKKGVHRGTISWTTDKIASGYIEYQKASTYLQSGWTGAEIAQDTNRSISKSITLTGLLAGTYYYIRQKSKGFDGSPWSSWYTTGFWTYDTDIDIITKPDINGSSIDFSSGYSFEVQGVRELHLPSNVIKINWKIKFDSRTSEENGERPPADEIKNLDPIIIKSTIVPQEGDDPNSKDKNGEEEDIFVSPKFDDSWIETESDIEGSYFLEVEGILANGSSRSLGIRSFIPKVSLGPPPNVAFTTPTISEVLSITPTFVLSNWNTVTNLDRVRFRIELNGEYVYDYTDTDVADGSFDFDTITNKPLLKGKTYTVWAKYGNKNNDGTFNAWSQTWRGVAFKTPGVTPEKPSLLEPTISDRPDPRKEIKLKFSPYTGSDGLSYAEIRISKVPDSETPTFDDLTYYYSSDNIHYLNSDGNEIVRVPEGVDVEPREGEKLAIEEATTYYIICTYYGNNGKSITSDEFYFTTDTVFTPPPPPTDLSPSIQVEVLDENHNILITPVDFPDLSPYIGTDPEIFPLEGETYKDYVYAVEYRITPGTANNPDGVKQYLTPNSNYIFEHKDPLLISGTLIGLSSSTTYKVWVRYFRTNPNLAEEGEESAVSDWMFESFTTLAVTWNSQPINIIPINNAADLNGNSVNLQVSVPRLPFRELEKITNMEWRINTDADFQGTEIADISILGTQKGSIYSLTVDPSNWTTNFSPDTEYYWQVRSYYSGSWSNWSNVTSFRTSNTANPGKPSIIDSDSWINGSTNKAEIWVQTSDFIEPPCKPGDSHTKTIYRIRVYPGGPDLVKEEGTSGQDLIELTLGTNGELIGNKSYYVSVEHVGSLSGTMSDWVIIKTPGGAPITPRIIKPARGSIRQEFKINSLILGGTKYIGTTEDMTESDWQIASDSSFTNIIWEKLGYTEADPYKPQITVDQELDPGTVYYVRVKYRNDVAESDWSSTVRDSYFTTKGNKPDTPSITDPSENSTEKGWLPGNGDNTLQVVGSLYSGEGSLYGYHVQISTNSSFTGIVYDSMSIGINPTEPLTFGLRETDYELFPYYKTIWSNNLLETNYELDQDTWYYIRLKYYNDEECWSDWSLSSHKFKTGYGVPKQPTITSPSNGQRSVSLTPTFTSSTYNGAAASSHTASSWYLYKMPNMQLVWSSVGDSSNKTSITPGTHGTWEVGSDEESLGKLYQARSYILRVKYSNEKGYSDLSPKTAFVAIPQKPLRPNILPSDNQSFHTSIWMSEDNHNINTASFNSSPWPSGSGSDIYGDHLKSQWEIYAGGATDLTDPGEDENPISRISSDHDVNAFLKTWNVGAAGLLTYHKKYRIRVRYYNDWGWSSWSKLFEFRTLPDVPNKPSILAPTNLLTQTIESSDDIIREDWEDPLTLMSTPFDPKETGTEESEPNGEEEVYGTPPGPPRNHIKTQWQISSDEDFTKITYDVVQNTNPGNPSIGITYDQFPVKSIVVPGSSGNRRIWVEDEIDENEEKAKEELPENENILEDGDKTRGHYETIDLPAKNPYLPSNKVLRLRVRHKNIAGWSDWSDTSYFVTMIDYPETPFILRPTPNGGNKMKRENEVYKMSIYEGEIPIFSDDIIENIEDLGVLIHKEEDDLSPKEDRPFKRRKKTHIESDWEIWSLLVNPTLPEAEWNWELVWRIAKTKSIVLDSGSTYTNVLDSDLEKEVQINNEIVGQLLGYNNTTNTWDVWIYQGKTISVSDNLSVVDGIGEGTVSSISGVVYNIRRTGIEDNLTRVIINETYGNFKGQLADSTKLDYLKKYRFRVRQQNDKGWSLWSNSITPDQGTNFYELTTTFAPPIRPVPLSPGISNRDEQSQLPDVDENNISLPEWYKDLYGNTIKVRRINPNPILIGSKYQGDGESKLLFAHFQIASDNLFENLAWEGQRVYGKDKNLYQIAVNTANGTFFTSTLDDQERLNYEGIYYWRVRHYNEAGWSDWSESAKFQVSKYRKEIKFTANISKELTHLIDRFVHPRIQNKSETFTAFINTWLKFLDQYSHQFIFNISDFHNLGKFSRMTENYFDWDESIKDANFRNYMSEEALEKFKTIFDGEINPEILRYFRELNSRKGSGFSIQLLLKLLGFDVIVEPISQLTYKITSTEGKFSSKENIEKVNQVIDLFHPSGMRRIMFNDLLLPIFKLRHKFYEAHLTYFHYQLNAGWDYVIIEVDDIISPDSNFLEIGDTVTAQNGATGTVINVDSQRRPIIQYAAGSKLFSAFKETTLTLGGAFTGASRGDYVVQETSGAIGQIIYGESTTSLKVRYVGTDFNGSDNISLSKIYNENVEYKTVSDSSISVNAKIDQGSSYSSGHAEIIAIRGGGTVGAIGFKNQTAPGASEYQFSVVPKFFWNKKTYELYDLHKDINEGWHGFSTPEDLAHVPIEDFENLWPEDKKMMVTLVLDDDISGLSEGETVVHANIQSLDDPNDFDFEKTGYVNKIYTENGESLIDVYYPNNNSYNYHDWTVAYEDEETSTKIPNIHEGTTFDAEDPNIQSILEVRFPHERIDKKVSFHIQRPSYNLQE